MSEYTFRSCVAAACFSFLAAVPSAAAYEAVVVAQGYPADQCMARREAKATVLSGQAVRLRAVRSVAEEAAKGEMINAELCWRGGEIIYVITVLSGSGKVVYVTLNAANGQLIGMR
jgi:uncharacterized membrane protein YkoI